MRQAAFALILATIFGFPAAAQDLDTSRLPRTNGSTQVYASATSTIYTAKEPVAVTADIVRGLLVAQGWRSYSDPFSQPAVIPTLRIMNLKRGRQALSVFITVAPAQNNATGVTYTALALANDLPFPDDATDIGFAPDRPHLALRTAKPMDETLSFFRKELADRGWSLWSRKEGAKQSGGPDGEKHDKGAFAYYVQENKRPLLLLLLLLPDNDGIKVELKAVPPSLLVAERQEKPAEPAPAPRPQERAAHDAAADLLSKEIENAVRGAISDALKPPAVRQQQQQAQVETLRAMAGNVAPVPVPDTASGIDFDGASGNLEFRSGSSVASIAAFYRAELKAQGWSEQPTPINRPNMVVLNFRKQDRRLNFTVMQMGREASVRADGSGLVTEAKRPPAPSQQAAKPAPAAPKDLAGEEMGGMPVPANATSKGTERTPFRVVLTANGRFDVGSLVAFYRRELPRKNWTEDEKAAVVSADRATLAYTTPDGPAVLKLTQKGDEAAIELSLRKPNEVAKAGLVPKPGQAKMMLGNMMERESSVAINKQTVKVGAGVGKSADGPKIDLPPGKHKYTVRMGGQVHNEEVEVAAGEVWGLMVGPGGALTLQMY